MHVFSHRALTVSVEFQKTKQPLKVYFDIDQNASFSDLQLLVSAHHLNPLTPYEYSVNPIINFVNPFSFLNDHGVHIKSCKLFFFCCYY